MTTIAASATLEKDRLPFLTKLVYGLADWGNTTTTTIVGFFFLFFLTDVALLPAAYATPVLLIGTIWDAINDPLIGVFADKVHTRWGRRRPFFLIGAIPFGLTFMMLWWVPPFTNPLALMAYYTVAYILFDTAFTFVVVPYGALTPELTSDYDERTRLTGYRMAVSMGGGLIAAFMVPIFAGMFAQPRTGYLIMAVIFGVLAMIPYFVLFFRIKERYTETKTSDLSLYKSFFYTWRNRAFRFAAGIYITAWMTVALISALFQYYITYWMNMAGQLGYILGVVQLAALICIPIIVKMSDKFGKTRTYIYGLMWWAVVMLSLSFLPSTARTLAYVVGALAGLGIAAAHVIPWSILPDVIDQDELETGHRREGTFYGFLVFLQKSGTALALALIPWVLSRTGYVPNAVQNTETLNAIRFMIGPVPAILLTISMLFAWKFPINREKFSSLRNALETKRENEN
ncbi:MAG: glycoside/pentoside/hexuronide:cation symporter GPH family [Chloroflexi bacterium]|nr:MAG: glycoside/pentoside/hexuronide:cation symporter GPH family [Chloroflexota bacterium]